jgi:hypothetical protein
MARAHSRGHLAVAASLLLAAGAACNPTPSFPAPAQPLVGEVVFERELTMGTAPIDIQTYVATLHVDPGTVPVGTKLVVRIVDGIVKELTPDTAGDVWTYNGQPAAVQLLADTGTFARPILLTVPSFTSGATAPAAILHADEGAATWTRVGQTAAAPPDALPGFSAELTEPHLWSFALPSAPGVGLPQGLFGLDYAKCGTSDLLPLPTETLEIEGTLYTWTRGPSGGACTVIERGLISMNLKPAQVTFTPDVGAPYSFNFQFEAQNAFELDATLPYPLDCPAGATTALSFLKPLSLIPTSATPGGNDGGCATDAGGSGDAQGG